MESIILFGNTECTENTEYTEFAGCTEFTEFFNKNLIRT